MQLSKSVYKILQFKKFLTNHSNYIVKNWVRIHSEFSRSLVISEFLQKITLHVRKENFTKI